MHASNLIALLFALITPLLFIASTIYLWKINTLLKNLKIYFPVEWGELGSPTLIINNSLSNSSAVVKWLLLRKYSSLGNQVILVLGKQCRFLLIVGWTAFILGSLSFVAIFWLDAKGL